MALTREQAIREAQRQMAASSGTGSGISESYIKELMGDPSANTAQAAQAMAATGTGNTTANTGSTTSAAQKIYDLQKQQQLAALEQQRQRALGALDTEQSTVAPAFLQQRTRVGVGTQKAARNFSEFLAQRGLNSSGAAAQGEISRNVAQQGALTTLREAEANTLADIARRRTYAEQDYEAGAQQAEYNRLIGLTQQSLQEEERARQEAALAKEREWQMGLDTINRYSGNYAQEIERRRAIDPNDPMIAYLESARMDKVSGIQQGQASQQQAQYEAAMERWKMIGQVLPQDAAILGVQAGTPTSDYRFKAANLSLSQARAARPTSGGSATTGSTSNSTPVNNYSNMTIKEITNDIRNSMDSVVNDLLSGGTNVITARLYLEDWNNAQKAAGKLSYDERERIYEDMKSRINTAIRMMTATGKL